MPQAFSQKPWLSMWFHPKKTIRKIIQSNPKYGVAWLSAIYVLQSLFFFFNFWSFGLVAKAASLLIPSLLLSPVLGFVWMFFYGWIVRFVGRLLGGAASSSHVRAALAWSRLPAVITLIMWLFLLLIDPTSAFVQYPGGLIALFVNLILAVVQIWTFILFVESIPRNPSF